MTKEELMTLLRNPYPTGQTVDELYRLTVEYPYFHTVHQLYLKGLQHADEKKMTLQLSKTALCVRDRDVLYHYINSPSPKLEILDVDDDDDDDDVNDNDNDINDNDDNDDVITDTTIINNEQLLHVIGYQSDLKELPQPKEEKQPISETVADDVHITETDHTDTTSVEIREVYSEKQLVADLIKITQNRTAPAETPSQNPLVKNESPIQNTPVKEELPPQNVPEKEELPPQNIPVKKELALQHIPVKEEKIVSIAAVDVNSHENESENRSRTYDDLIDSFLKSNPKIIPNDSNYEVNLSDSLQDSQEIATETLADIYATQGHIDKAIEIYEQLILKNPKKRIYFAAQIERIKVS